MKASPTVNPSNFQGTPIGRSSISTASLLKTRNMISRPSVITATEKSGSPIMGRIANRSTTSPTTAANARATMTLNDQCTHGGPPRLSRGLEMLVKGMWPARSTTLSPSEKTLRFCTRNARNSAPVAARAPWAKLTVWVALKMSTKPSAIRA